MCGAISGQSHLKEPVFAFEGKRRLGSTEDAENLSTGPRDKAGAEAQPLVWAALRPD